MGTEIKGESSPHLDEIPPPKKEKNNILVTPPLSIPCTFLPTVTLVQCSRHCGLNQACQSHIYWLNRCNLVTGLNLGLLMQGYRYSKGVLRESRGVSDGLMWGLYTDRVNSGEFQVG